MAEQSQGTQVERLQESLKHFVMERDYFEQLANVYYEKLQAAEKRITELEAKK